MLSVETIRSVQIKVLRIFKWIFKISTVNLRRQVCAISTTKTLAV